LERYDGEMIRQLAIQIQCTGILQLDPDLVERDLSMELKIVLCD
jgi:hypothetical protein